jgi:peptidyl-prolyl cis-trans isomerase C
MRIAITFMAREPFFQFLFLGLLIWIGVGLWKSHSARYLIHVTPADRQRIATHYSRQFGEPPTAHDLQKLLDRHVREEIYLREGEALHLDQDDEIVRRRIIQKYEFLQTDLAVCNTPTEAELRRWFEEHKMQYLSAEQVAFSHVYFSVDRGSEAAKTRASRALATLRASGAAHIAEQGDPFAGPSDVGAVGPQEASRLFGESELALAVFRLQPNRWSGPYRSGYGWHLVYVTEKKPAALPAFRDIKDRVLADYQDVQRATVNARTYEKLRSNYTVLPDGTGQAIVPPPVIAVPAQALN